MIETPVRTVRTSLHKCLWFIGYSNQHEFAFGRRICKCIILCVPGRRSGVAVGLTPDLFNNVWAEFLSLAEVPQGRARTWWEILFVVGWGVRGLGASAFIAAIPGALFAGNRSAEFARIFSICGLPLAGLCYGTVHAGSSWWYFRQWGAYLYSIIWFAVPSIVAAAWVGGDPQTVAVFITAGLLVHLCLFADLRRRSRANLVKVAEEATGTG